MNLTLELAKLRNEMYESDDRVGARVALYYMDSAQKCAEAGERVRAIYALGLCVGHWAWNEPIMAKIRACIDGVQAELDAAGSAPDESDLTIQQAAELLGKSTRTVRRYIDSGALPAKKVGRVWRIKLVDLRAFATPAFVFPSSSKPRITRCVCGAQWPRHRFTHDKLDDCPHCNPRSWPSSVGKPDNFEELKP